MKVLGAPQKSVKIKILVSFLFSFGIGMGKVNIGFSLINRLRSMKLFLYFYQKDLHDQITVMKDFRKLICL